MNIIYLYLCFLYLTSKSYASVSSRTFIPSSLIYTGHYAVSEPFFSYPTPVLTPNTLTYFIDGNEVDSAEDGVGSTINILVARKTQFTRYA